MSWCGSCGEALYAGRCQNGNCPLGPFNPKLLVLALGLSMCGCGGNAFSIGAPDASDDTVDSGDESVPGDSGQPVDSGGADSPEDHVVGDAADDTHDAGSVETGAPESGVTESGTNDAPEEACVLGQSFQCGSITITPPTNFCWYVSNNPAIRDDPNTPAQCATCSTYTCDCIVSASPQVACIGYGIQSCDDSGGQVTVVCN